jgi:hypothetical protein
VLLLELLMQQLLLQPKHVRMSPKTIPCDPGSWLRDSGLGVRSWVLGGFGKREQGNLTLHRVKGRGFRV